jgi:hypothetical protein
VAYCIFIYLSSGSSSIDCKKRKERIFSVFERKKKKKKMGKNKRKKKGSLYKLFKQQTFDSFDTL